MYNNNEQKYSMGYERPQSNQYKDNLRLNKGIYTFLKFAKNAGFSYTDVETDADKTYVKFGDYKNNDANYRIGLSKKDTPEPGIELELSKGNNGQYENVSKLEGLLSGKKNYAKLFIDLYNKNREKELPKIRNYDLKKIALYSFAAAYGATEHFMVLYTQDYLSASVRSAAALSVAHNIAAVDNAKSGLEHLALLAAPFVPLQFSKKTRSLPNMLGMFLTAWSFSSLLYYPTGMLMGYTKDNIQSMLNWYKTQSGFGNGYYFDHYGPLTIKVTSAIKGLSYAGRMGLAFGLSKSKEIFNKVHKIKRFKPEMSN